MDYTYMQEQLSQLKKALEKKYTVSCYIATKIILCIGLQNTHRLECNLCNTHCQMVTEPETTVRSLCTKKHERMKEERVGKTEFIGLGGRLRGPCLHFQPDSY